jgi:hypothetical protein
MSRASGEGLRQGRATLNQSDIGAFQTDSKDFIAALLPAFGNEAFS